MNIIKVETYKHEKYHIYSVCDVDGESVIDKIADSIDHGQIKQVVKLGATIKKAAESTPKSLPNDRCHKIIDDIWQFRADDIRVLWFYDRGSIIVCAHSFIKKNNKTPPREIRAAKKAMNEYFIAKGNGRLMTIQERDNGKGII